MRKLYEGNSSFISFLLIFNTSNCFLAVNVFTNHVYTDHQSDLKMFNY